MTNHNLITKIGHAGVGAIKSFLGVIPSTEIISAANYQRMGNLPSSGWLFDQPAQGVDTYFSYGGLSDIQRAYENCAPVFSIINKQAYAFTNGKTWILDRKTKKESQSPFANKIRALLHRPNPLQSWKQFEAQAAIYIRLFGYCIILPIKPKGELWGMEDASAFWIIPPYMCTIEYSKQTFYTLRKGYIQSITIQYGSEKTVITNVDELIFLKDITPGFDSLFMPASPIKPLQQNINNLIGIYNAKGMLINYRGALGILTPEIDPNGAISQTPEEKEEMQNDLMRYGIKSGQWKFIVANSAMKWQQIGISYRELMLTEWGEDDMMVLCDGLNYPYKLLSNNQSSSMNGTEVAEWKKQHYQDFVIPFGQMIYEQLGEAFKMEENGVYLDKDYSHVEVLQTDKLKEAQSRKARNDAFLIEFNNNMMTMDRWLELNGEDPHTDKAAGKLYYHELIELGWKFGTGGAVLAPAEEQKKIEDEKKK